jgi:uncharacterized Zn finger protein
MRYRKVYGRSRITACPFCSKQAISQNKQKIPTCLDHKTQVLPDMKCACGSWLDLCVSKHGPYFRCLKCGNVNWQRAMEINGPIKAQVVKNEPNASKSKQYNTQKKTGTIESRSSPTSFGYAKVESKDKKEVVIKSDEVDFI